VAIFGGNASFPADLYGWKPIRRFDFFAAATNPSPPENSASPAALYTGN
jgi:hypothetical protein